MHYRVNEENRSQQSELNMKGKFDIFFNSFSVNR